MRAGVQARATQKPGGALGHREALSGFRRDADCAGWNVLAVLRMSASRGRIARWRARISSCSNFGMIERRSWRFERMIRHVLLGSVMAATLSACQSYAGVAAVGPDKVVITRNDGLLFGLQRKIYVCQVTANGLTGCVETREDEM